MTNEQILESKLESYNADPDPRVGDWVEFPVGNPERISYDWGDGVQTSIGGSFYLGDGFASFSGALNPVISKDKLVNTGEVRNAFFWYCGVHYQPGEGIRTMIPVRVYRYEP